MTFFLPSGERRNHRNKSQCSDRFTDHYHHLVLVQCRYPRQWGVQRKKRKRSVLCKVAELADNAHQPGYGQALQECFGVIPSSWAIELEVGQAVFAPHFIPHHRHGGWLLRHKVYNGVYTDASTMEPSAQINTYRLWSNFIHHNL